MEQEAEQVVDQAVPSAHWAGGGSFTFPGIPEITVEPVPESLALTFEQWFLGQQIFVFDLTGSDQEAEE
jgi:hypothetical protein